LKIIPGLYFEGGTILNRDLEEYISKRCEKALAENEEYKKMQKQLNEAYRNNDIKSFSDLNVSLQILVESICYKACMQDLICMSNIA
jgi:hypothetical protein